MAQRYYGESSMNAYNQYVALQEHLDSIRQKHGSDLWLEAYVSNNRGYQDSLRIYYNALGKIDYADKYALSANSVWEHEGRNWYKYDVIGRLILINYIANDTGFYNHRHEINYNNDGLPMTVLSFRYTTEKEDTLDRYLFSYSKGKLLSKTIQGWDSGSWKDHDRTYFEYDSLDRMVVYGSQSTASTGQFTNLGNHPQRYEYDSLDRIKHHYLTNPWDTTSTVYLHYIYSENKLAYEAYIARNNGITKTRLSSIYFYDPHSGYLVEELQGGEEDDIWKPYQRELYSYYSNGLVKEYQRILKWPDDTSWNSPEEMRRYYYNRTE